jgi:hypothetical protein
LTPLYATREDVLVSLDLPPTTQLVRRIDRLLAAATEDIFSLCHRSFYPVQATRTFDWRQQDRRSFQPSWKLYLDENSLISLDSLTVGGNSVSTSDVLLRPDEGPPYTWLEIDINASRLFEQGDTHQRAIEVAGLFGYQNQEELAATISGAINDSTSTLIVSDGGMIGVGDLLRIESERLLVSGRSMSDSGQDLGSGLDQLTSDSLVQVADGTEFHENELISIGSENMRIEQINGNDLVVKRSIDGTVLAAHTTGADIFVSRSLSVERAALSTTAASHSDGADVHRFVYPALVRQLAIAKTERAINQEKAGYDGKTAQALIDLADRVYWAHGRTTRLLAV